jgi:hypothetical protein
MTDSTNVCRVRHYDKKRSFYQLASARLAHPDDNTMWAYCGKQEHSALHHEDGFKWTSTAVSIHHPSHHSNFSKVVSIPFLFAVALCRSVCLVT